MKVVHAVQSDAFAGVERYIATVAPRLQERAVDVAVIGGEPAAMVRALGAASRFTPARTTVEVAQALRRVDADIVHVHMTAAEFAAAVATRRRQAIVSTRHFLGRRGRSLGGRAVAGFIRRRLRHQVSISDAVATSIGEPSTRIYNGVANRERGAHAATNVLLLQRLEHEKDTALALHAWAHAHARADGWVLDIAGDGAQRSALVELTHRLGIADSVRFLGHVTDPEAMLADAGILLATAPAEPFGLSVVEAMASGAAVVAASGGGHLETVGGAPGARMFAPGDAPACAARIDELVADATARRTYGDELQRRQRELFDIEEHVARLIELYERIG